MRDHIAKIASSCFYHLRRLRQLRRIADQPMLQRLVSVFGLSRTDYCNSVLAGPAHTTLAPLQRVLRAAICLVARLGPRDHVTDSMKAMHWLPVPYRIKFKLCVLMHSCKYLGVYLLAGHKFKCNFDEAKAKYYCAFNGIMGKVG